jgi:hypothetical protein
MRIRIICWAIVMAAVVAGCASAPPQIDATPPAVQTPLDVVEQARDVATDVSQRQITLEGQLRDPFSRP